MGVLSGRLKQTDGLRGVVMVRIVCRGIGMKRGIRHGPMVLLKKVVDCLKLGLRILPLAVVVQVMAAAAGIFVMVTSVRVMTLVDLRTSVEMAWLVGCGGGG